MPHFEKRISSERIFEGRIVNLRRDMVELENGDTALREVVEHPGGVCILAVDEQENALFVEQFRYGVGELLLELPAGKLEYGEDPLLCGIRELQEECGCTADQFLPLTIIFPTCAYNSEIIHIYLARGLHFGEQQLDHDEFLTVKKMPVENAMRMVLSGMIPDAKTQAGVLQYWVRRSAGLL